MDLVVRNKPQLRRQGKPKVKTGCLKCKARRVKCDEVKPQCRRCVSIGFDCKYAPSTVAQKIVPPQVALRHIKPCPSPAIAHMPDSLLSANPEERRYFHLYCQNTAAILSGYFHSDFWSRIVPQTGRDSAPVRHAIAAVSALLKSLETTPRSPLRIDAQKRRDEQYQFALRQYTKAISALRNLLYTKDSYYRTVLIVSILFMSIETLQGDLVSATMHISGAFSLAVEASGYLKPSRKTSHLTIDDELIQMFTGLMVQNKLPLLYTSTNSTKDIGSILSTLPQSPVQTIPSHFATINAAKASLDSILKHINRLDSQSSKLLERKAAISEEHQALLKQWEIAFSPLFQKAQTLTNAPQSPQIDAKNYASHFILASTHALAIIISTSNAGCCSEMLYDSLTTQFQRIVDYSKVVINAMCSSPMPRYIFDVGVLPPLHVAASKCRDPCLRREAIKLLRKCPAQEGVWEGYRCAKVCKWLMVIEEGGDADGTLEYGDIEGEKVDSIPEWNRVKLISMVCWMHKRMFTAQCTSALPIMHGSHRMWERAFSW